MQAAGSERAGWIDEQDAARLREQAASMSVTFIPEDEDLMYRLPDPAPDLQ